MLFVLFFFFFNDTATTEIYTLSLHDALPICRGAGGLLRGLLPGEHAARGGAPYSLPRRPRRAGGEAGVQEGRLRSEEHTSELQSRQYLVCRLLLEKKKNINNTTHLQRPHS